MNLFWTPWWTEWIFKQIIPTKGARKNEDLSREAEITGKCEEIESLKNET